MAHNIFDGRCLAQKLAQRLESTIFCTKARGRLTTYKLRAIQACRAPPSRRICSYQRQQNDPEGGGKKARTIWRRWHAKWSGRAHGGAPVRRNLNLGACGAITDMRYNVLYEEGYKIHSTGPSVCPYDREPGPAGSSLRGVRRSAN